MTIYGRYEELVSRCVECNLAEPESLTSQGGSTPGVVDGILSLLLQVVSNSTGTMENLILQTSGANIGNSQVFGPY